MSFIIRGPFEERRAYSVGVDGSPVAWDNDGPTVIEAARTRAIAPSWRGLTPVAITRQPDCGWAKLEADGSVTVQTHDALKGGSIAPDFIAVEMDDGSERVLPLLVASTAAKDGWFLEDVYRLAEVNGVAWPQPGPNTRLIYISNAPNPGSWNADEIAADAGVSASTAGSQSFLVANPQYGSLEKPLHQSVAFNAIKGVMFDDDTVPIWAIYERGYAYDVNVFPNDRVGPSPLHGHVVGDFGTGAAPFFPTGMSNSAGGMSNTLFLNLSFSGGGFSIVTKETPFYRLELDHCELTEDGFTFQGQGSILIRNFRVAKVFKENPKNGSQWDGHGDRISGVYSSHGYDLLFEDGAFIQCGFEEAYWFEAAQQTNGTPHPASVYSHNAYFQGDKKEGEIRQRRPNIRRTLLAQAAQVQIQFRNGGTIDTAGLMEGNSGFFLGGDGAWSSADNCVITSAAFHANNNGSDAPKALAASTQNKGDGATWGAVLTVHPVDPDNPDEVPDGNIQGLPANLLTKALMIANRKGASGHSNVAPARLDEVINIGWGADRGVPPETNLTEMQARSVRRWGAGHMGVDYTTITVQDVYAWLRTRPLDEYGALAEDFCRFFLEPTGRHRPEITGPSATPIVAVCDENWDCVSFENARNWSPRRVPGILFPEPADVDGYLRISNAERHLTTLQSRGGRVVVKGGRCVVDSLLDALNLVVYENTAGEFWFDGGAQAITAEVRGGRLLNQGNYTGVHTITGRAEEIVFAYADNAASSWEIGPGSLVVLHPGCRGILDGAGGAAATLTLALGGELRFVADASGTFGQIVEQACGWRQFDPVAVASAAPLAGLISIDASATTGEVPAQTIINVGAVSGAPTASVDFGPDADRSATVTVTGSAVTVAIAVGGGGAVTVV